MRYPEDRLRFTADPLMCGVMDGAFLKDALRAMPHLRSVFVGFNWREAHGIGWDAIEAILSAVQLREFTIRSYMFCPRKAPARDLPLNHFALLTAFNYERISSQPPLHAEEQRQSLAIVLGARLQASRNLQDWLAWRQFIGNTLVRSTCTIIRLKHGTDDLSKSDLKDGLQGHP